MNKLTPDEAHNAEGHARQRRDQFWSEQKVLKKIQEIAELEEDMSSTYINTKYPALMSATTKYLGSWKRALEMLGYDYAEVKRKGRLARLNRKNNWYKNLLISKLDQLGAKDAATLKAQQPLLYRMLMFHFKTWAQVMRYKNSH